MADLASSPAGTMAHLPSDEPVPPRQNSTLQVPPVPWLLQIPLSTPRRKLSVGVGEDAEPLLTPTDKKGKSRSTTEFVFRFHNFNREKKKKKKEWICTLKACILCHVPASPLNLLRSHLHQLIPPDGNKSAGCFKNTQALSRIT